MLDDERQDMIDIGAGPTIYSAICFRNLVKRIYLTDFCRSNLKILQDWLSMTKKFDWASVMKTIARYGRFFYSKNLSVEAIDMSNPTQVFKQMEDETRQSVVKGGVFHADVHDIDSLRNMLPEKRFDILVSIFCLEVVGAYKNI